MTPRTPLLRRSDSRITSLAAALEVAAEEFPGELALADLSVPDSALTYGEWFKGSAKLAETLAGSDPLRPVVLYFHENEQAAFAVAFLGVLRAGLLALPMSNRFTWDEVQAVRDRYGSQTIIPGPLMAEVPLSADQPGRGVPTAGRPHHGAGCVLYTSGTTGTPKGVLCLETDLLQWLPGFSAGSRPFMHQFPFDTAAGLSMLLRALRQYPAVHVPLFRPADLARAVEAYRPRDLALTPAGVRAMTQAAARPAQGPAAEVESVIVTSATCRSADVRRLRKLFPRARLVNLYSSTEAGAASTMRIYGPGTPVDPDRPDGLITVGRPTPWSQVRITDRAGREVEPGTQGRVWLRAKGSAHRTYFPPGEASPDDPTFVDGWTRTGDLGLVDEAGILHLAGREADTINKGGINVSASQIEMVLAEHPGVRDAAVFALPHEEIGEELYAAVTCSEPVAEEILKRHVTERLGRFKTPARIAALPRLPMNSLGKVRKTELRRQVAEMLAIPKAPAPACHEQSQKPTARRPEDVRRRVRKIWKAAFANGSRGNFFENGGDSLTAVEIAGRIGRDLAAEVSLIDVLENPTPDGLADWVVAHGFAADQ